MTTAVDSNPHARSTPALKLAGKSTTVFRAWNKKGQVLPTRPDWGWNQDLYFQCADAFHLNWAYWAICLKFGGVDH
jgi:hypothetical protein